MILWAAQRTGSSTLMNWIYESDKKNKNIVRYELKKSSQIPFPNLEIFNKDFGVYRNYKKDGLTLKEIFDQDFNCKIHPEYYDLDFIKNVIINSQNHQHIILYRENTFERIISNHYAWINKNFDDTVLDEYKTSKIDVDMFIDYEIANREKYRFISNSIKCNIISYEDIFIRKNKNLLKKIFPYYDVNTLLKTERYKNYKRYNEIKGIAELKTACDQLGDFIF